MPHLERAFFAEWHWEVDLQKALGDFRRLHLHITITLWGEGFLFGMLWLFEIFVYDKGHEMRKKKIKAIWKVISEVLWAQDSLGRSLMQKMTEEGVLPNE